MIWKRGKLLDLTTATKKNIGHLVKFACQINDVIVGSLFFWYMYVYNYMDIFHILKLCIVYLKLNLYLASSSLNNKLIIKKDFTEIWIPALTFQR